MSFLSDLNPFNPNSALGKSGLAPILETAALNYFAPGFVGDVGTAMGGVGKDVAAGAIIGGVNALATGSLQKGLMAGLQAYGTQGIGESLSQTGTGIISQEAGKKAVEQGLSEIGQEQAVSKAVQEATGLDKIIKGAVNPGAAIKGLGAANLAKYGSMAAGPVLMAASQKNQGLPSSGATAQGYIRPKYYDYRTQTFHDLPAVKASDWGSQNLGEYRSQYGLASDYPSAAKGGLQEAYAMGGVTDDGMAGGGPMMGSNSAFDFQQHSEPVVRMAEGGDTKYTQYTPEEINNYIAQNNLGWQGIAEAEKKFNADPAAVEAAQQSLARTPYTYYTPTDIADYITANKLDDAGIAAAEKKFNADPQAVADVMGRARDYAQSPSSGMNTRGLQELARFAYPELYFADVGSDVLSGRLGGNTLNNLVKGFTGGFSGISNALHLADGGVASPSDTDVKNWFAANPSASDKDIAAAMDKFNVGAEQVGRVTGLSAPAVQSRYDVASGYTPYTQEQIGNFFTNPANANVNVADAIKQFKANPAEVNQYITGLSAAYKDPTDTQRGTGYIPTYQNLLKSGIDAGEFAAAAQGLNKDWGKTGYWNPTTTTHAFDVAQKVLAFDPITDKVTPSDKEWVAFMDKNNISVDDISRATGLSKNEVQARYDAAKEKPVVPPVVTQPPVATTPSTYAPKGTATPYGNIVTPGDITQNVDSSLTVTPNIPSRPYGGFTGMQQLRDAYTAGGGNLGQVLAPTKPYTTTGESADAYKYLMGQADWKAPTPPTYTAPKNPKYIITKEGQIVLNPDYVDPSKATTTTTGTTTATGFSSSNPAFAGDNLSGTYAEGGISDAHYNLGGYSDGGRLLRGPGDGVSDSIPATIGNKQPARLADGEFVVPARIVSELGNGSTEAGARKLYAMMDRVQKARGKTVGKGRIAKNTRADKYLPA